MKIQTLLIFPLIAVSCKNETKTETPSTTQKDLEVALKPKTNAEINIEEADTPVISKKHKNQPNKLRFRRRREIRVDSARISS